MYASSISILYRRVHAKCKLSEAQVPNNVPYSSSSCPLRISISSEVANREVFAATFYI